MSLETHVERTSTKPVRPPRSKAYRRLFVGMVASLWLLVLALAFRVAYVMAPHEVQKGLAWVLGKRPHFEQDALLGWAPVPNLDQTGERPDGPGRPRFQTDGLGLRSPAPKADFVGKRLVLLGDSMVWGVGVDQSEHVATHLRTQLGPSWEVLVAAAPGWSTDQEYLFLQNRLIALKPTVVIWCLTAVNDIVGNLMRQSSRGVQYPKPRFVWGASGALELQPVSEGVPSPSSDRVEDGGSMLNLFYTRRVEAFEAGVALTGALFRQAKREFSAEGMDVKLVAFKPNLLTKVGRNVAEFAEAFGYPPSEFSEAAALERLARLAEGAEQPVYYFDTQAEHMFETDGHLSPKGHTAFAAFLARLLEGEEAPRWTWPVRPSDSSGAP